MKIQREDLTLLKDVSRRSWIELPAGACLPGTFKALTEEDRIAVSWLQAAIDVLSAKMLIDRTAMRILENGADLQLEFDYPDSTTMTDGYDSTSEKDDKKE